MSVRIALVHATPVAIEPIKAAFEQIWPTAETVNLLDDSLTIDRQKQEALSEELCERFVDLCKYGVKIGADGILVTCSAFGPAIERAAQAISCPVLKPNQAMFEAALERGNNIGMIATFPPAILTMVEEFSTEAARIGSSATVRTISVPDAMTALRQQDSDKHNSLIAARVAELGSVDAVMLAHFSTSRAAEAVRSVTNIPVLTAPEAAVRKLRAAIQH